MDKTDELILQILRQDSRLAFVDIATKVGLSEAAIRRRVSNLVKEGTIKGHLLRHVHRVRVPQMPVNFHRQRAAILVTEPA